MGALSTLTFAAPWVLAALAVLPVIWWLLKVNPPAPRRIDFPAARFLFNLRQTEETPTKTPLWLLILRLVLAGLFIVAAAGPQIDRGQGIAGDGPVLMIVDDGWRAAPGWDRHVETALALLDRAGDDRRAIYLATSAPGAGAVDPEQGSDLIAGPMTGSEAREIVRALRPKPWPADRAALLAAIEALLEREDLKDGLAIEWLSDGLSGANPAATEALAEKLSTLGALRLYRAQTDGLAHAVLPPEEGAAELTAIVVRGGTGATSLRRVRALGDDGRLLARGDVLFAEGEDRAEITLQLPRELRNEVAALRLEGEASAGAVVLLDERWRRRPVGLVSGGGFESSQPLLSDLYYLERALAPYHEVRQGTLATLIEGGVAVLGLVDVGRIGESDEAALDSWLADGGVLVRFAGPRLAEGMGGLLPVRLREGGGRTLGGALSWTQPMELAPFEADSVFAGFAVPEEVTVTRQVLAEPSLDPDERTWARLHDGTPLVSARRHGAGWLILFHTTANADWSTLALSGLFVDMMRRIVDLSQGVAVGGAAARLAPLATLDGFGRLGDPPADASPIGGLDFSETVPAPRTPPGWYGTEGARRALNVTAGLRALAPLPIPFGATVLTYEGGRGADIGRWLLVAAILLALVDTLIALGLRGLLLPHRSGRSAAVLVLGAGVVLAAVSASPSRADSVDPDFAMAAGLDTVIGYVATGDPEVDAISVEGLQGLTSVLWERTAVEPGKPMKVDPETDELAFFPWIYWPIIETAQPLSERAISRVDAYLRGGGLILFDTRDQSPTDRLSGETRTGSVLGRMLEGFNIPPLIQVPEGHAITRAFYLLDRFPGQWDGETIWVERYEGDVNDGVSTVIIGGNGWAAAWARGADGRARYPIIPGGARQRERALRFGVNLTMYALTGNYKADQVHVPSILRRLGHTEPVGADDGEAR